MLQINYAYNFSVSFLESPNNFLGSKTLPLSSFNKGGKCFWFLFQNSFLNENLPEYTVLH